jgi:very-short-patch-repair endonuclease
MMSQFCRIREGIKVMRFWDLDVLQDVDSVLDAIVQELEN